MEHRSLSATRRTRGVASSIVAIGATLLIAGTAFAGGWSTPLEIGASGNYTTANSHSTAAVGSTVHALLWNDQSVAYVRSSDAGATYPNADEVSLAAKTATVTYYPSAIAAAGPLVVAIFKSTGPGTKRSLLLRRSTDGGATWKPAQTLASLSSATTDTGDGDVAVVGTKVVVAWTDRSSGRILSRRSTDSGATFKPSQLIGTTTNPAAAGKDGEVTVAAAGTKVYVVWIPLGTKGIALRRSTDSGATWKPQQTVSSASDGFPGPSASASGLTLLVVYTLSTHVVKVARSANGGSSVASSTVYSGGDWMYGEDVLVSGSQARVSLSVNGQSDVSVRSSTNGGATWGPADIATSSGGTSNLSLAAGHTVVVYGIDSEFSATAFSTRSN
jgi:hypothetical protein